MRPSEIVMTLCAINDHDKEHGLSRGQKSWKTRLMNQLKIYHIAWAKNDHQKALIDFFIPINNRTSYNIGIYDLRFRKDAVITLREARLKLQSLKH